MKDIKDVIASNDLEKLLFYKDYYLVIIDIYKKRNLSTGILERELKAIIERIAELS